MSDLTLYIFHLHLLKVETVSSLASQAFVDCQVDLFLIKHIGTYVEAVYCIDVIPSLSIWP